MSGLEPAGFGFDVFAGGEGVVGGCFSVSFSLAGGVIVSSIAAAIVGNCVRDGRKGMLCWLALEENKGVVEI